MLERRFGLLRPSATSYDTEELKAFLGDIKRE